jgi:SAM-dependent methyltransferase
MDTKLSSEIARVYAEYDLYFQGVGNEQKIFRNGVGAPRSQLLLEHVLSAAADIDRDGPLAWMDFGCGKGNLLRELSRRPRGWKLYGADLSESNRGYIEDIPGVVEYFSGGVDTLTGEFDVLSLSHVLEHVPTPLQFLKTLRKHIKPDGHLLIAVPSWHYNPMDLLVVDHCIHFTQWQLSALLRAAGFALLSIDEQVLPKELVAIARPALENAVFASDITQPFAEDERAKLESMVNWLATLVDWGNSQVHRTKTGLLGTALAATWLDYSCNGRFDFFVDEDADRANTQYLGRSVCLPADAVQNADVLVPLPAQLANGICMRLNALGRAAYIEPPPLK